MVYLNIQPTNHYLLLFLCCVSIIVIVASKRNLSIQQHIIMLYLCSNVFTAYYGLVCVVL